MRKEAVKDRGNWRTGTIAKNGNRGAKMGRWAMVAQAPMADSVNIMSAEKIQGFVMISAPEYLDSIAGKAVSISPRMSVRIKYPSESGPLRHGKLLWTGTEMVQQRRSDVRTR